MREVVRARCDLSAAVAVEDGAVKMACHKEWVSNKERPSPLITKLTSPPVIDRLVVALRDRDGRLEARPGVIADIVAEFWATTSGVAQTSADAQAKVLVPLIADKSHHIKSALAARLGDKSISPLEIKTALGKAKSGSAPGPDGVSYDFYKEFSEVFVPLLSRVFTVMGHVGETGAGFLDGAISILYKKGDRTLPANYRPITLLNTDYRVLAKVLASRLGGVLNDVIAVEQTAFLKDRQMGENVVLLQLLPRYLKQKGETAVVAFCDFAKAYDTIDRSFLYQVMEVMGVGEGFLGWVKMLLSDTYACAVVNGHVSKRMRFMSGVRQGCPLAPLLYLFVAQALHSWLRENGLGLDLGKGRVLPAAQYADDTKAMLKSLREGDVRGFLDIMVTFQHASGQRLNESKTELLPIGALGVLPLPATVCNLKVVSSARGVGVIFTNEEERDQRQQRPRQTASNSRSPASLQAEALEAEVAAGAAAYRLAAAPTTRQAERAAVASQQAAAAAGAAAITTMQTTSTLPPPLPSTPEGEVKMDAILSSIKLKFATLSKLGLSIFGRAAGAAAYGVSMMLFQAEHTGMPTGNFTNSLQRATTRLVDRGQAPDASHQALTGVLTTLLHGRPCEGGFGMLPVEENIRSRHACWGARFLSGGNEPTQTCFFVAIQVLELCHMYLSPLALGCHKLPSDMSIPGGTLRRMHEGLLSLPPMGDVCDSELELGDWCHAAPLWGNPLLPLLHGDDLAQAREIKALGSLGELMAKVVRVQFIRAVLFQNVVGRWEQGDHEVLLLNIVISRLPPGWWEAATHAHHAVAIGSIQRPVLADALAVIIPRLGWRLVCLGHKTRVIFVSNLRVRDATALQLSASQGERVKAHACFIHEAYERGGDAVCSLEEHGVLNRLFVRCWGLCWENKKKEIFWRLAVDGVADGHRWINMSHNVCACGVVNPRRDHFFWGCPVAVAVVQELHKGCVGQPLLIRANVWLMHCPVGVPEESWVVACLAALNSMDVGRRKLLSLRLARVGVGVDAEYGARPSRVRQRGGVQSNAERLEVAKGMAVSDFRARIADFMSFKGLQRVDFWGTGVGV